MDDNRTISVLLMVIMGSVIVWGVMLIRGALRVVKSIKSLYSGVNASIKTRADFWFGMLMILSAIIYIILQFAKGF